MIVSDSTSSQQKIQSKLKAINSLLLDTDVELAEKYLDSLHSKILHNRRHEEESKLRKKLKSTISDTEQTTIKTKLGKVIHKNYPRDIIRGDIVYIEFGCGVGDELSDYHYGVVLARRGRLYIVAPLTKTKQPYENLNVVFKDLGLPGQDSSGISYVSLNHIRSVSLRRITRIAGLANGKIFVGDEIALKILNNYNELIKLSSK